MLFSGLNLDVYVDCASVAKMRNGQASQVTQTARIADFACLNLSITAFVMRQSLGTTSLRSGMDRRR